MRQLRKALARWSNPQATALSPLGTFVDELLQAFEDRRAGLKDDELRPADAERFFGELYGREQKRLREAVVVLDPQLPAARREALCAEIDELVRGVLVPAYARLATSFTGRERNDFFLARGPLRALERVGWVAAGLVTGGLVVWAPFIPLWSKHWIWIFGVGGLFAPEVRRYLAWRRYERELNVLVIGAGRELERVRESYLLGEGAEEIAEADRRLPRGSRDKEEN